MLLINPIHFQLLTNSILLYMMLYQLKIIYFIILLLVNSKFNIYDLLILTILSFYFNLIPLLNHLDSLLINTCLLLLLILMDRHELHSVSAYEKIYHFIFYNLLLIYSTFLYLLLIKIVEVSQK